MKRCFCACGVFASLFLLFLTLATAQNDRGSITGKVTDSTGAIVAGASVKVTNTGTGSTFEATTGADGLYATPEILQVGTYRVEASHSGFKTAVSEDLDLRIGDVREVNLTLQVGQAQERVTVTAGTPIIETETSSNGDVIEGRQVTELPLRDRNFTSLALLTPGVDRAFGAVVTDSFVFNQGDPNAGGNGISDSRGDTPASRFSRSGGSAITANGLRTGNNNFTLDGVDDNEPIFGEIGVFPNPDAIQEFQVQTSLAKAESGRGGAQVNTSLKSGSNDFHGLASYYGQNAYLNATAALILRDRVTQGLTATELPKTQTHVNEFGGMIGGPIIKNRTFFFGDYLGQRNSIPNAFRDAVPTAGARNGDFSAFTQQLVDPGTGGAAGLPAGTPLLGNVIPNLASRADFSPIAQKIYNLFPLPNCTTAQCMVNPSSANNPNYFGTRKYTEKIDSFDIKIDHRFSNSNNANFRFTRDNQNNTRSNFFPGQLPTAGFGAGVELGNTRQVVATDTHIFSPTILNEVKFGYTSVDLGIDNCGVQGACGVSPTWCNDFGIPNCNKGTAATTGGLLLGIGGGSQPGDIEFLGDGGIFQQTSHSFYVADSVTIIKGKHTWKAGLEVRPHHIDQLDSGGFGDLKGAMAWSNGGTSCSGTPPVCTVGAGHTGVNQADALLSVSADFSNSGTVAGGDKAFQLHNIEYAFYVQDDWKATPNLTLNLGVRWDILPLYHEVDHRIGNFDPTTLTLNRASGSQPLVDTRFDNVGPRVGFAYSFGPQRNMVMRGGIGVFYALEGFGGDYPLVLNPPNVNQVFDGGPTPPINLQTGPPVATVTDPPVLTTGTTLINIPKGNFKNETIYEANLSFEYQFAKDYVLDVGYAGNRSRHLLAERQLGTNGNGLGAVSVNNGTFGCGAGTTCFFGDVRAFEGRANEDYDSLQAKLEKRFSAGLVGTAAYTWSHNIDNSTGLFGNPGDQRGNQGGPIDPLNFNIDRASSALDHRHVFSGSILYDLPFGKGKRYATAGGVSDKVFGGWQLNVILNGSTGQHFSVIGNGTGSGGTTIANIVGDPYANRPPGAILNVNAFQDPIAGNPGTTCINNLANNQVCWGNSGRNHFTGPGYFRTDMSLFKNTKLTERVNMQIGFEAYNLLNQDNALVPNTNIDNDPQFGTFVNTILPPRIVQYRFKLIF